VAVREHNAPQSPLPVRPGITGKCDQTKQATKGEDRVTKKGADFFSRMSINPVYIFLSGMFGVDGSTRGKAEKKVRRE
jgi:hypothetical protein